ncbi:MAG: RluA family pseudouridine synthase [Acidobacteria bacterium]|nr:RluA family pseudouridine synthase [Acidobacteriota bacterium]
MDIQQLTTTNDDAGKRLDAFLASQLRDLSRTRLQRAIEDGEVLINERAVKPSYKLRAGDQIEIDLPEPPPVALLAEPLALDIVYEDEDLIVVDKPAGMIVHPGAGIESGTLANALVYHFNELSGSAGRIRPGIVHRIDKDTSGLLVVAKNDAAHTKISEQFHDRKVFKMYVALVYGRVSQSLGDIEANIGRSPHNRTRMAVLRGNSGRYAHTIFQVVDRYTEFSLLQVQIKTGRTHQIRVHLSHIGHPVVSDTLYGMGRDNTVQDAKMKKQVRLLGRHFLHAAQLEFTHPTTGELLKFASPMPHKLTSFLALLKQGA